MSNYGYLQAQLDLKSAALYLAQQSPQLAAGFSEDVLQALKIEPDETPSQCLLGLSDEGIATALTLIWSDGPEYAQLLGTCLALIDRLEVPSRGTDFEWEWDAFQRLYEIAPAPILSAIMNGFYWGRSYQKVHKNVVPTAATRITNLRDAIAPALLAIAKRMNADQIESVAHADYGCDVQKHANALHSLLATEDCLYRDSEVWYPAEENVMTTHDKNKPAYFECTAIVLLNSLNDEDDFGHASFRLSQNAATYRSLQADDQRALYRAFRYHYETDADWSPLE